MSTATIILIIVCILVALVCFAFINQSITTRKEQRARIITALKARIRTFKFMTNGMPEGFLSKELTTLVQRSLTDVLEQLCRIEPNEAAHRQDLQLFKTQLGETQRQTHTTTRPRIDNPQQIKEVRACLEELHKFVYQMEEKNAITRNAGKSYRSQIKDLLLQVTVDNYTISGTVARQNGKTKLALHHYQLALDMIVREQKTVAFKDRVENFRERIAELSKIVEEEEGLTPALTEEEQVEREQTQEEWDRFEGAGNEWRKKNVYD